MKGEKKKIHINNSNSLLNNFTQTNFPLKPVLFKRLVWKAGSASEYTLSLSQLQFHFQTHLTSETGLDFCGSCYFSSKMEEKWLQEGVKGEPSDAKALLPSILLPCVPGFPDQQGRAGWDCAGDCFLPILACIAGCATLGSKR